MAERWQSFVINLLQAYIGIMYGILFLRTAIRSLHWRECTFPAFLLLFVDYPSGGVEKKRQE